MMQNIFVQVFNRLLTQEDWARSRLLAHRDKHAEIRIGTFAIRISIEASGLVGTSPTDRLPDLHICLPLDAVLNRTGSNKQIQVSGDAEFAEALSFVLKNLRWDVEESLAQKIGDIPAHRLASLGKNFFAWQWQAVQRLNANMVEYMREEKHWLISQHEMGDMHIALSSLCDGLTRMEKRIERLTGRQIRS